MFLNNWISEIAEGISSYPNRMHFLALESNFLLSSLGIGFTTEHSQMSHLWSCTMPCFIRRHSLTAREGQRFQR